MHDTALAHRHCAHLHLLRLRNGRYAHRGRVALTLCLFVAVAAQEDEGTHNDDTNHGDDGNDDDRIVTVVGGGSEYEESHTVEAPTSARSVSIWRSVSELRGHAVISLCTSDQKSA